jgi:L-alanine-DL-glutamate epimerase-like enolase superfamily enzyme
MQPTQRRNFLKRLAATIPASAILSNYDALAAPLRRQVKIADVKCMVVQGIAPWNMIKIETDGGLAGIGESYWGRGVKDIVLGYLRDQVVGADPLNIEPLCTKMMKSTGGAGAIAGVTVTAISGVEIALWDLAGKILNAPVAKLLGGQYREGVPTYWTGQPADPLDPASCQEFATMIKSHPYHITAIKSQADSYPQQYDPQFREPGHEPNSRHLTRQDLSRIARGFANLREAAGEKIDIAVHCHWEYDWIDALELARAVAPIKPMWLEDPMPPDFSESWVKLTQASPVPILTGENLYRRQGFQPFIVNQGCHLVHIDIPKAGGLLESKKIADLADLYYLPVCAHNAASPLGTLASAHCAASIRDFRRHELSLGPHLSSEAWEKFVVYDGPIIKDGKIRILDKPGFGAELNEDYVRANLAPGEQWWG